MRAGFLQTIINLVFPAPADVALAASISEESLLRMMRLRSGGATQKLYTALPYAHAHVRALVRANKYYADTHAARVLGAVLGELLVSVFEEHALDTLWHHPLLVPAPTAPSRARHRGAHQVKDIVKNIPSHIRAQYVYADVLSRHNRESQIAIPKSKRLKNVAGAFYVPEKKHRFVEGKNIFLIDDVIESGATMKDMRRALYEAGANDVIGIALAT